MANAVNYAQRASDAIRKNFLNFYPQYKEYTESVPQSQIEAVRAAWERARDSTIEGWQILKGFRLETIQEESYWSGANSDESEIITGVIYDTSGAQKEDQEYAQLIETARKVPCPFQVKS